MAARIPKRVFGSTGEEVSIIAFGGGHIGNPKIPRREAVRIMQRALDEGITFFETAWEYRDGFSESRMGEALKGRRDRVFLMTKVCSRDRASAERQLHESLRRLQTDHVDLWQFHEVNYWNDPDWIFAPGGAAEAAAAALQAGKTRFVGFTGHKDPDIHLKMLENDFPWASVQMPVNVLDASFRSFIANVLPVCRQRGIAAIGMKSLGGHGQIVEHAGVSAQQCRRFALSQSIATLVCGIESMEDLEQDLEIARRFAPMTEAEQQDLISQTRGVAGDGHLELFKTTQRYDSAYHRRQHHFPDPALPS